MPDCNFAVDYMNTNNHYLGWLLQSLKHCISDLVVFCSKILKFLFIFLNFVTFNWEIFQRIGKNDIIFFSWDYDSILALNQPKSP